MTTKKYSKWLEEYYKNRQEQGNYCVIYEQEQWDGFANNLDLLEFMEEKGWEFVHSCKDVEGGFLTSNCMSLAERTSIELVFRRINR